MKKAVVIAATLNGGVQDVLWCMEADPAAVDVVYLACQRKLTAESFANIPSKEQPTYEELEGYKQTTRSSPDIAWGERYPELCAWLTDYENNRKRRERDGGLDDRPINARSLSSGAFNYARGQ
jgi:hypothetical protein